MIVTVTIPRKGQKKPSVYTLECPEDARVLQVLHLIHERVDPTLAFRTNFCKRGSCGLCMVMVNKRVVKACKTPIQKEMLIEPLPRPHIRDLAVGMDASRADAGGVQ